ncbi:uncharacterized protein LOC120347676 isoform X1 [Styela clava]
MPWSLRKFLSKDTQQTSDGGDKGRNKSEKISKLGKIRQQLGKVGGTTAGDSSNPIKNSEKLVEVGNEPAGSQELKLEDFPRELSSNDELIDNDEIIKSDDEDYKSLEDFPEDCSNLTGYLESAIMESPCNTLERYGKSIENSGPVIDHDLGNEIAGVEEKEYDPNNAEEIDEKLKSSSFDRGLYIEYVNYDLLGAEEGSNGSSGEYYSSDEEKFQNSNNNSNNQLNAEEARDGDEKVITTSDDKIPDDSLRVRTGNVDRNDGANSSNNIPETSYYGDLVKNTEENRKNEKGNSLSSPSALERNENSGNDDKSSEKDRKDIDLKIGPDSERKIVAAGTEEEYHNGGEIDPKYLNQEQNCCVHNDNVDVIDSGNNTEMEKARSIFGMCLCQNGEQVDNVTDLDFRNCNLKQVPHDIFQYAQTLTHLQLDSNTLSDLPKSLFSCENLEYLTVSDNDLGSLPPTLAGLSSLRYLDISKNVIEDVPDCIRCCKSLSVLDASVNPIERLSEGFTQLVGLSELYLNDCFLEFLPASFGRLVQLTVLELRDNQLQILPKSIRRLTLLKRLDLGGNIFQEWPDVVCELRKLTELWLDGNELSRVPDDLGELTSLVYLDLSRNFIEAIPSQIGALRELADLILCENHVTVLPDTIGFLDKLTLLKASMNQLTGVPESIGKLKEIEELDLSHNKMTEVPSSIGNLTKMHTLLLDNNVLSSVPSELGKCGRLNVLQLSRNMLEEIPREIGELSQLRVFNICRNRLPHLPITVIKLAQLEALWVSSNQSKPNVPLHAELAKDGKTRILTNILFPQVERDLSTTRERTDEDGYAIDAADDDEPPLFRKQRGITRVAFNLQLIEHSDITNDDISDDDDMEIEAPLLPPKDKNANNKFGLSDDSHTLVHSVNVSADIISNGNSLNIQSSSLMVRSPDKQQEDHLENGDRAAVEVTDISMEQIPMMNGGYDIQNLSVQLMMDTEEWSQPPPSYNDVTTVDNAEPIKSELVDVNMDISIPDLVNTEGNLRAQKPEGPISFSTPDLSKSQKQNSVLNDDASKSTTLVNLSGDSTAQPSKIKTWSSHSHLPAIPSTEPSDIVEPVAVEIMNKDDRSSMSSSPISASESPKPEQVKTTKLPIPSRALFDKMSAKEKEENVPFETKSKTENDNNMLRQPYNTTLESRSPIPLSDIPFMDSDVSDVSAASDMAPVISKPKKGSKPPPPPRTDSLLLKRTEESKASPVKPPVPSNKPSIPSSTGLKVFTPAFLSRKNSQNNESDRVNTDPDLLALPADNKPSSELSPDGLASTDRDSGVGNDVDSQESIPECPDEDLPLPPHELLHDEQPVSSRDLIAPAASKPLVKSVATFQVSDTRIHSNDDHKSSFMPVTNQTEQDGPPPHPNKVSANIKMFESIASPEHKTQSTASSRSLADLLPTGPRKTEEKAIIRPNNHLNGFIDAKNMPDTPDAKPGSLPGDLAMKPSVSAGNLIMESQTNQVAFVRSDDEVSDSFAISKALDEVVSPMDKKKISRSNSKTEGTSETVKHDPFRERLEKIMQQQRNVSAATKAAQSGAALSLSRKASFNTYQSQPTSPDGSGLEKLTAENAFSGPELSASPGSPDQKPAAKKHSVHDRMKSKLDRAQANNNAVKSASSSRIARSRPGSAPAAQLLQRRNSNQRNSIAAPENNSDDKRTLAPLFGSDERAGLDARARSKSIEQQLGQLFLDSDEEQLNHNDRANYELRKNHNDVIRREHKLKKDPSGVRGSRNSLCSPPPVRHNMYAKARSSTNAASAPLADWKHKLLQHIERKRVEKQHMSAFQGRPKTQQPTQSIGRIKSPPRTSGPSNRTQYDRSNYVTLTQPQARNDHAQSSRQLSKSVTAPSLMAPTKTITNTHQYNPEGPAVRSHFAGNSRAAKLAKQRTFTPGPESSHGNPQMMAPRPKSAMDKFATQSPPEPLYAEPPSYRQPPPQPSLYADLRTINPPLPTYEDHLHRRAPTYPQENNMHRLVRSESQRKSFRSNSHGRSDYDDIAAYPLRHSGSHESLMDAARYNQHDPYFPTTPIRNASSHDSILDQQAYPQPGYPAPYYSPKQARMQNNGYPPNHIPQRYPVVENPKRSKYPVNPDYATYVNVYDYDRSPVEYHNRPQVQSTSDPYRSQLPYHGGVRNDPRQPRNSYKHEQSNYKNYAYPPTSYHNARQPPTYDQRYRPRESISPTLYRPLAEREEESVASAFRPYHQVQQQVQPRQHKPHSHHHHHMPYAHNHPYNPLTNMDYKNQGHHLSPTSNYQYMSEQPRHMPRAPTGWADQQEDFERVTVNVRRNPTFGFHVMGGVGAGGNPYQPMDEGVFVTHVTPGGAADNKLQAGDKILLVNGSDFVGISHKRAVDLLRNAGQVAVLVVERSLGKPV